MGRKIEFDYLKAIGRATRLFWAKGYSQTSLRDLLKAMRIGEGSFYNSVKSKSNLFLECLKHYNGTVGRRRLDVLFSKPTVKEGVRSFFETVLDELDNPKTPRLCLLAGSLSRDVLEERSLRSYVLNEMKMFIACFSKRLEAGKAAGELPGGFDSASAAGVIVTYLQGLFRAIEIVYDRPRIEKQIDLMLSGLGL